MNTYDWVERLETKEKIRFFITSGYDYTLFMNQFNLTYTQAKNSIKWAIKQFKTKIGFNTVKLIKEGFIEEARAAFYMGTGKFSIDKFVVKDLVEVLPEPKFTTFSLEDCENELAILANMSIRRLNHFKEVMESDKMAYILYLLQGSGKKADLLRPYIIAVLQGNLKVTKLVEMEDELNKELYI